MKRYLLFGGNAYYAAGGWRDFRGAYDTEAEAVSEAKRLMATAAIDWWHIADTGTASITAEDGYSCH